MSVAYLDNSVATLFNATSASYTTPFPYDSKTTGTDRFLVVTVMHENGATGPTAITYGGLALTQSVFFEVEPLDNFSETGYIWTLIDPPTGINDVVISGGASLDGGATAAVYTGVNQTTPIGNVVTAAAIVAPDATAYPIVKQDDGNLIVWAYVSDRGDRAMVAVADNVGLVLASTAPGVNTAASSFGTGYRAIGSGEVLVGADRTAGTFQSNGMGALELISAAGPTAAPTNAPTIDTGALSVTTHSVSAPFSINSGGGAPASYEVRINGGAWTDIGLPSPLVVTVDGLSANTAYSAPGLELRGVNSGGPGPVSAPATFTTDAVLATPVNTSASNIQSTSVTLNWNRG